MGPMGTHRKTVAANVANAQVGGSTNRGEENSGVKGLPGGERENGRFFWF